MRRGEGRGAATGSGCGAGKGAERRPLPGRPVTVQAAPAPTGVRARSARPGGAERPGHAPGGGTAGPGPGKTLRRAPAARRRSPAPTPDLGRGAPGPLRPSTARLETLSTPAPPRAFRGGQGAPGGPSCGPGAPSTAAPLGREVVPAGLSSRSSARTSARGPRGAPGCPRASTFGSPSPVGPAPTARLPQA